WTCFDNFEWAEGYSAKFGLIACDPATQERRVRQSARLYAEICRANDLPVSVELPPAPRADEEPAGPTDLRRPGRTAGADRQPENAAPSGRSPRRRLPARR